ncbi:SpoIIE family protein phosphatase [Streptomyces luteireticuli]|uniref:SpoIIE family protein phosphatase n=1 Tax=Streptomyces luteireticuli TaxID=173858 RepID=A0ABN0YFM1_9ACTN
MTGRRDQPGPADPLGEELAAVVHRTGTALGGALYLRDPREPALGLAVVCGRLPAEMTAPWRRLLLTTPSPATDAVRQERLVWVASQEDMARRYPAVAAYVPYPLAVACAPLKGRRHCWGVLVLLWPASHGAHLGLRERERIAVNARRIARALDKATGPPEIPEQPREVPLHRPAEEPEHPAQAAADLIERLPVGMLALDREARITLANPSAARLLGRSVGQLYGKQPWQSLSWLDTHTCADAYRTALSSREPSTLTVLRPPDHWLDFRLYADDDGVIILIGPHPTGADSTRLSSASHVGPASAGGIYQLMHLAAALAETVRVQDVVDRVADQILPAFGAQGLIMGTVEADRMPVVGHRGYDRKIIEQLDGLPTDAALAPIARSLAVGTPAFFADRAELARAYPESPPVSDKNAWAFLPLVTSGRPIGYCLLAYDEPHEFTAAERSLLTPLAGLIAQALDRARLYDAKHGLAHALQQTLLPQALPTVAGLDVAARYLPSSHGMDIGGDFYDLIRLTDTTTAAVIGDVQGHDVTAAALMGQARTAVHSHATAGAPPDQVLARTDRDLADLDAGRFVSCLYAHLDLARHRLTLASAGHPPPLLHHPGHRAHTLDIDPGPPLGLGLGTPSYPLTSLALPEGSLLALYTDGLVEVPGADIGQTTADLARHLNASSDLPLHQLIDSLVDHTCPTGRHTDDIALLLLQPHRSTTP